MSDKHLVIIQGPTAVGKTDAAIFLAQQLQTEIVSCDSRQFYREMSIGTAVPDKQQLEAVPHHCIHHKSIHDYYNVYQFEHDALAILERLFTTHRVVVMVGGSGMYIDTLVKGIDLIPDPDPELRRQLNDQFATHGIDSLRRQLLLLDPDYYQTVDLSNQARIIRALEVCLQTGQPYSSFRRSSQKARPFAIHKIGITLQRELLYNRINLRVDAMMQQGLLAEVESLLEYQHLTPLNTVGYKELFPYFENKSSLSEAVEQIKQNTRRYAKKQISWFNRFPEIVWYENCQQQAMLESVVDLIT